MIQAVAHYAQYSDAAQFLPNKVGHFHTQTPQLGGLCKYTATQSNSFRTALCFCFFTFSTMSDFEGDFDDELLELAGATEKKRKHQASSSRASTAKKRRTE